MTLISQFSFEKITITTDRLQLRGALDSDAAAMFKSFSDPEVMRYWSTLPHKDVARTSKWISSMTTSKSNGVTDFIICLKPDMVPIGKMGIWQGDEIGFLLAREHWGKGLAKEALTALLRYFFRALGDGGRGLDKIVADTDPQNTASIRFLKSFGFQESVYEKNTIEVGGEWMDSQYFELTRLAWDI